MNNNRKQRILTKLASSGKVIGSVLRGGEESAEQYLRAKAKTMPWSKMLKRTGTYQPKGYELFPIVGKREAKRLQTTVS